MRIALCCCRRNYLLALIVSDAIRCRDAAFVGEMPSSAATASVALAKLRN